jgi:hypothetical protein
MLYNMACSSSDEIETLCELMRRKCSNINTDISDTDVNCDRIQYKIVIIDYYDFMICKHRSWYQHVEM